MQKGYIFLLIIWNSFSFASGNTPTNHLQFSLGCQAVIPCQCYTSDSFKWSYKKDERSSKIQIFFKDKNGLERREQRFRSRMGVLHNGSLVIYKFTEDDQGLYLCEFSFQDRCQHEQFTVLSVRKDILKETHKTFYVTAGSSFTHECPGELTNLKWTFEASNKIQESYLLTSNKSIYITNIKRADAGKYTCWTSGCDGHKHKLLIINLCVITVHHSEDSFVSCAVMCDVEFSNIKSNSTSNVETGTVTVPMHVDPYGSLNCSAKKIFTVNNTHEASDSSNQTTGTMEPEYLIPVIYGTSAALTCLILMALLICYLRPILRAAFPIQLCCCGSNGSAMVEEESSVVYSSVVIRRPAKTSSSHMTYSDCVYSEIKL